MAVCVAVIAKDVSKIFLKQEISHFGRSCHMIAFLFLLEFLFNSKLSALEI